MSLLCFGHRGAAGHAPENTLRAIDRGIELGAEWVEIDVQLSADEALVVVHDHRLPGVGAVAETSLEALRRIDLEGERIPTLDEVFDRIGSRAGLNIELKGAFTAAPVAAAIEARLADGSWTYERLLVSSFNHHELKRIKALLPDLRIGALTASLPLEYARFAEVLGAYSLHANMGFVDSALVEDAHRRGLEVFIYTVNEPDDLVRMAALGVDGVISDFPERVRLGG